MANEITSALLQANGGLEASVLSDLLVQQLYDATDLSAVCTKIPWQPAGGQGLQVTLDAVPGAYTASATELADAPANAAYTTSKYTLTPVRYAMRYQMTDLVPITGARIGLDEVANKLVQGVSLTITDKLTSLFPGVTAAVGNGTTAISVDTIFDAAFQLNTANNAGTFSLVLSPAQINSFRSSLRAESGAVQFREVTYETLRARGPGYQGFWSGIDLWQSDSVTAPGGVVTGAMFSNGAFAMTMADPRVIGGNVAGDDIIFSNELMMLERDRNAVNATSSIIGNIYLAMVMAEDARAVEVRSS